MVSIFSDIMVSDQITHYLFKHGTGREVLKAIRKGYPVGRIVVMSMLGSGVGMWIAGGTEFLATLFLLRF